MRAAIVLLALAYTAVPCWPSETRVVQSLLDGVGSERLSDSGTQQIKPINVLLRISIPSQRLVFAHQLKLLRGMTASQAVESVYNIQRGLVCCDARDVKAINGLTIDPYTGKWWVVRVNGNMQNSSPRTELKDGDTVEWEYEEAPGSPPAHTRLEDWVANVRRN